MRIYAIIQAVLGTCGTCWDRWCGTLISISTLLLSCSAGLAVKLVIALLIEDAVIVGLLEGEPLAVLHLIALKDAFFERGDGKRVNKDSFALKCAMTFSGWTFSLATDAVGAGLNGRRIYANLGAVVKKHTELEGWLPGPPVAILVLATELVTPFGILSHFEVKGIFLALAIHVALPGLRDVHLSVLDFGNLIARDKIQN